LQSTAQRQAVPALQGAQSQPLPDALQVQAPAGSLQVQRAVVSICEAVIVCSS
jgi:hypothetical protein